ncbi:MAG: hypothetical protein K2K48_07385 [Anaeroplasmataceae bacterium]|nr:hypothetical protein [Anaeroplasmataceae bacterium]MDE6415223.1 hypothetical protein [Anaeroplasmataceae bacterium]
MEKSISEFANEKISSRSVELEKTKDKPQSKFFIMMLISIVALVISSIECILLSVDFSYIFVELIIVAVFLGVALIYSCFFSKNKTKWNLFILLLIASWLASMTFIGISSLKMWSSFDTTIRVKLIFPCVYQFTRYKVEKQALGVAMKSSTAIYFNWIISFGLSLMFILLYWKELRQKKRAD